MVANLSVEDELARLRDLDLKGLRARWRGLFRKESPPHLPRHLLFGLIAYRLQVDCFGDLEPAIRRALDAKANVGPGRGVAHRLNQFDQQQKKPAAGTILMREWAGKKHRVMVMTDGFAWNGTTYRSLSQIAFAMTGTRWNGPRFFGLRQHQDMSAGEG